MDFNEIKKSIDEICRRKGIADYKMAYNYGSGVSVSAVNREILSLENQTSSVLSFTAVCNGRGGTSSVNVFDQESLERLVEDAWDNASCLEGEAQCLIYDGSGDYRDLPECVYSEPEMSEVVEKTMQLQNEMMDSDSCLTSGSSTSVGTNKIVVALANSKGLSLQRTFGYNFFDVDAIVTDKGDTNLGCDYGIGPLEDMKLDHCVKEARDKLGAGSTRSRVCKVVLASDCMRQILSAFSPVFFGKNALLGISLYKDKVGEVVASDRVTLVDDPFEPSTPASIHFDADGVPTYKKMVIEKGRLQTLLYNLSSAKEAGCVSTGNAGPYLGNTQTCYFSFYLAEGVCSKEELLEMAGDDGLYVTEIKGLHAGADETTGDFSIDSAGFEISGGKKGRPVKNFTISGNFYEMLKNVEALSDKIEFGIPGGVRRLGSPEVLVSSISVAGE